MLDLHRGPRAHVARTIEGARIRILRRVEFRRAPTAIRRGVIAPAEMRPKRRSEAPSNGRRKLLGVQVTRFGEFAFPDFANIGDPALVSG